MSELSNEEARDMVATMRHELKSLTGTDPVEGYAAEDEIREAVDHLDAAIVDLDNAILNED
jgi:hypothetical protein